MAVKLFKHIIHVQVNSAKQYGEMQWWCYDTVGQDWDTNLTRDEEGRYRYEFGFDNDGDAMLFTLKWK